MAAQRITDKSFGRERSVTVPQDEHNGTVYYGGIAMNKKKITVSLFFFVVIIIVGCVCSNYLPKNKTIFPLKNIGSVDDAVNWQVCVLNDAQDKILFDVNDPRLLYGNRELFSIRIDDDVNMTTPQYVVKILKNNEISAVYYLIDINQINFGTIPYSDIHRGTK